ncbi:putative sulfate exporter family transporter [Nocardioides carbamazepini]|uniref:YeiH family protein n=1 Tax=Nocardioides carbamazepini TaxID=2854259 RepID=UPI002149CDC2|nr:putative sulfate exporter family transporter [Nocardioides carbamazepini]MCR1782465.1 putative sulfate exporter family transporter [Nocardioides carbamazepini]
MGTAPPPSPSSSIPSPGPATTSARQGRAAHARRALLALAVAGVALAISTAVPLLGPLLVALVIGVVAANTPGVSRHVVATAPRLDKLLLRSGIVLLGLKIAVTDILALGPAGVAVVIATVVSTYVVTQVAGRLLGLERDLVTLIAAGFSICGAAAVAAVESSIKAAPKNVALAVTLVTVFGTIMIGAVPALGHVLGLTDAQTAIWAGASIHEVAQVIAAGSLIGTGGAAVLAAATTVKLARVTLLAPVQVVSARMCRSAESTRRGPVIPLFLVGFLAAVAIRSTGVLPQDALDVAAALTTLLLSAAMFGLGTGIIARQLWPAPVRALLLATISTAVAATVALTLVALLI